MSRRRSWLMGLFVGMLLCWGLAQPLALAAIHGYQRWISPHKGWRCAWSVEHHGISCSQYGERSIAAKGLLQGLWLLHQRFGLPPRPGHPGAPARPGRHLELPEQRMQRLQRGRHLELQLGSV